MNAERNIVFLPYFNVIIFVHGQEKTKLLKPKFAWWNIGLCQVLLTQMLNEKQPHERIPGDKLFSNSKDMTEHHMTTN